MDRDSLREAAVHHKARSVDTYDRRPIEQALVREGVHRKIDPSAKDKAVPHREDGAVIAVAPKGKTGSEENSTDANGSDSKRETDAHPEAHRSDGGPRPWEVSQSGEEKKGQAHDPTEEFYFLAVGPEGGDKPPDPIAVSESPPATDIDIYEKAYHDEVERIRQSDGTPATLYLTRRVEGIKMYQDDEDLVGGDQGRDEPGGLARLMKKVKSKG